jgi:hypothetical protein
MLSALHLRTLIAETTLLAGLVVALGMPPAWTVHAVLGAADPFEPLAGLQSLTLGSATRRFAGVAATACSATR